MKGLSVGKALSKRCIWDTETSFEHDSIRSKATLKYRWFMDVSYFLHIWTPVSTAAEVVPVFLLLLEGSSLSISEINTFYEEPDASWWVDFSFTFDLVVYLGLTRLLVCPLELYTQKSFFQLSVKFLPCSSCDFLPPFFLGCCCHWEYWLLIVIDCTTEDIYLIRCNGPQEYWCYIT